ncbi:hypothetical protein A2U01_0044354, partial [Trifolium medium]|nr:hypothetical protein [Trifolium medium]
MQHKSKSAENAVKVCSANWWQIGSKRLLQANWQRANSKQRQGILLFAAKVCFKQTGSEVRRFKATCQQ